MNLDAVIPTLNGSKLLETIKYLNAGSYIPNKIFCIYFEDFDLKPFEIYNNIIFIKSSQKGQINQRNKGFEQSKSDLVLQLDDDVLVHKDCLKLLVETIQNRDDKFIVGPVFFKKNKKPFYTDETKKNLISNIYKFIICDAPFANRKNGKYTSLTMCYGVNDSFDGDLFFTEWLPGGCLLFNKKLLKEKFNPFPFDGKAYCEDLFFSIQRKNKGFVHVIKKKAIVYTDQINSNFSLIEFVREIKIRYFLLSYTNGSKVRFFIWVINDFFIRLIRYLIKLLTTNNKVF